MRLDDGILAAANGDAWLDSSLIVLQLSCERVSSRDLASDRGGC